MSEKYEIVRKWAISAVFDELLASGDWSNVGLASYEAPIARGLKILIRDSVEHFIGWLGWGPLEEEDVTPIAYGYLRGLRQQAIPSTADAETALVKNAVAGFIRRESPQVSERKRVVLKESEKGIRVIERVCDEGCTFDRAIGKLREILNNG